HRSSGLARRKPESSGCGPEFDFYTAGLPVGTQRNGVGTATATLPRATAPRDVDHVEFGYLDGLLDRRSDLIVTTLGVAHVAVAVADGTDTPEFNSAPGVGHPLDHVDVEYFVLDREQLVGDLRFLQGKARV